MNIDDSTLPQVVTLRTTYLFIGNYIHLVADPVSKQAVVIDPAWQMDRIDEALMNMEAGLRGILLTHAHPDHTHLAQPMATKYDCPIWMSNEEIAASGFRARRLIGIPGREETPWSLGSLQIQPLFTPGHTPGGICYLIGDNLFTGDTLFAEGCGVCPDVPAAHDLFFSLKRLKERLRPETRIFPGHSYGKPPGQRFSLLLKENIYLQFSKKDDFAAYRLRKGQDLSKIFNFS